MYKVIWKYEVITDQIDAFKALYDSNGVWVQLFKLSEKYIKTELFQETNEDHIFITIDYWESQKTYDDFYHLHKDEIESIDALGDILTISEEKLEDY